MTRKHANRLRMQLAALDTAQEIADLDIPGYGLYQLKGDRKGTWVISVSVVVKLIWPLQTAL
ncbi:MAG: type II toxin-antitoxin system RelE/ParE family toxin [Pseudohongiellaceae bacterium]